MAQATIVLNARDNTKAAFSRLQNSFSKLRAGMFSIQGLLTGGLIVSGFKKLTGAFDAQEQAEAQLSSALGYTSDKLLDQASALQKVTLYGDEATISAQSMLASYVKNEDQIEQITPLIQDMATRIGMDLNGAAQLLAKTLGSSTNALARYGIEVTGTVGSSERLETLMAGLSTKFKGAAKAAADAGTGGITQFKMAVGDSAEDIGAQLVPMLNDLTKVFLKLPDSIRMVSVAVTGLSFAFATLGGPVAAVLASLGALAVVYNKIGISAEEAMRRQKESVKFAKQDAEAFEIGARKKIQGIKLTAKELVSYKLAARRMSIEEFKEKYDAIRAVVNAERKAATEKKKLEQKRLLEERSLRKAAADAEVKAATEKEIRYNMAMMEAGKLNTEQIKSLFAQRLALTEEHTAERVRIEEEFWAYLDTLYETNSTKRKEDIDEAKQEYAELSESQNLVRNGLYSMQDAYGNMFAEIAKGGDVLKSADQAWRSFTNSVIAMLGKLIAKLIIVNALSSFTGPVGSFFAPILKSLQTPVGATRKIYGNSQTPVPVLGHGGETVGRGIGSGLTINFTGTSFNSDQTARAIVDLVRAESKRTGMAII